MCLVGKRGVPGRLDGGENGFGVMQAEAQDALSRERFGLCLGELGSPTDRGHEAWTENRGRNASTGYPAQRPRVQSAIQQVQSVVFCAAQMRDTEEPQWLAGAQWDFSASDATYRYASARCSVPPPPPPGPVTPRRWSLSPIFHYSQTLLDLYCSFFFLPSSFPTPDWEAQRGDLRGNCGLLLPSSAPPASACGGNKVPPMPC